MKKYFAYGSNLSFKQMGERCTKHRKIGKGVLEGYANVIKSGEGTYRDVPGGHLGPPRRKLKRQ